MKAMLSQPMNGKTEEEIKATREKAIAALEEKGYEVVNTLFTDEWYSPENMKERGVVQRSAELADAAAVGFHDLAVFKGAALVPAAFRNART